MDHGNSYDWMAGLFPDGAVWRECRITAMKGGAILEIQDGKDRFRRRVLRGSDPLILPVHGVRVRILSIVPGRAWVASAGLPEAPPTKDRVTRLAVYAYARKGVNAEVAKGLTLALSGKLPVYELQVTLSDSPWFINDSEHPGRWPYMENVRFPSRAEHLASKSIVCQSDDRGIMCKQTAHY
ncbi:MAG: hypothetical protein HZB13_21815 [Acidobacteria bacterium]|nr:hypothetical protein [Acidobacteriota bacterium]